MKRYWLLVLVAALAGCEPQIKIQPVSEQKAYVPFSIGFDVIAGGDGKISPPEIKLVNKHNLAVEVPVSAMATPKGKHAYTVDIQFIEAGDYRLAVTIPYRTTFLGIPLWRSHKTVTQDFTVHINLPLTCFNFDHQDTALTGWKSTHVYIDDKDKPVSQETCPGLFFVQNSWPWPLDYVAPGGSLFIPVSSECFPKTGSQVSKQSRWMFSVVSPDLTALTDWQKLKAVQFRIATNKIAIKVRPELHYLHNQQNMSTPSEINDTTRYDISGDQWRVIEFPVRLDAGDKVTRLELHLSGIPEQTVGNKINSIFIDGVCPVPNQ